jgi:hypothetical protein
MLLYHPARLRILSVLCGKPFDYFNLEQYSTLTDLIWYDRLDTINKRGLSRGFSNQKTMSLSFYFRFFASYYYFGFRTPVAVGGA